MSFSLYSRGVQYCSWKTSVLQILVPNIKIHMSEDDDYTINPRCWHGQTEQLLWVLKSVLLCCLFLSSLSKYSFFTTKSSSNHIYWHINFETRGNNTLDLVYTMEKNTYKSVLSPLPGYDLISVMLIPAYKPLLKLAKLVQNRSQNGQMLLNTPGLLSVHRLEHVQRGSHLQQ